MEFQRKCTFPVAQPKFPLMHFGKHRRADTQKCRNNKNRIKYIWSRSIKPIIDGEGSGIGIGPKKKRTDWLKKGSVRGSAVVTRKIGVKSTFYQKQAEKQKRRPEIRVKKKDEGQEKSQARSSSSSAVSGK